MTADEFPEVEFTGLFSALQGDRPFDPQQVARTIDKRAIEALMDELWRGPYRFCAWRRPPAWVLWGGGIGPLPEVERAAWEAVARSAWIESVRAKLQSAVYATDHGWSWTWDAPGIYGRPDLPPGVIEQDITTPPLWAVGDDSSTFDDLRREANIRLLTDHLIAIEPRELDLIYSRDHPDRPKPMTREQARAKAIAFLDRHA